MIKFDKCNPRIEIDLKPGVYEMGGDSGDGKTYLFKKLEELCARKYPVIAINCLTVKSLEVIEEAMTGDYSVVVFDRFDVADENVQNAIRRYWTDFGDKTAPGKTPVKDRVVLVYTQYTWEDGWMLADVMYIAGAIYVE